MSATDRSRSAEPAAQGREATPLRKVMCVEDDADIRQLLQFSLGTVGGYEVLCCDGGIAALAAIGDFRPDLILSDVMMPGMSGPELLAALHEQGLADGVPVVFLTAKAMPDELERLLALSATGIIVKPFDPLTLPDDIRMYWEHGRGTRP